MPSHTAASALIKLWFQEEKPWHYSQWQEITEVYHGLFPDDDRLLPVGWTRQNATQVKDYFDQYQAQATETAKLTFAAKSRSPGRQFWTNWIRDHWEKWKIHDKIVECLREHHCHPMSLMLGEDSLEEWPPADNYLPMAVDSIGMSLFALRSQLLIFGQRSWARIRAKKNADLKKIQKLEIEANSAFQDIQASLATKMTKAAVLKAIRAVGRWKMLADIYETSENRQKAADMTSDLLSVLDGLAGKVKKSPKTKRLPKGFAEALAGLASEADLLEMRRVYMEYFKNDEDDGPVLSDSTPTLAIELQELEQEDLGIEEEANLDSDALSQALGFKNGLPWQFQEFRHRLGYTGWEKAESSHISITSEDLDPLRLHWHQLSGLHAIIRTIFTSEPDPSHCTGMLVADEAIQHEYKYAFHTQKKGLKNDRPWQLPPRRNGITNTIFDQRFSTVTVDEAHEFRNSGIKQNSILSILQRAKIRLALTGTPLHTAPKDISSMARLIGIAHFFSDASIDEARKDAAEIRRAKKKNDGGLSQRTENIQIVRRLQSQVKPHMLRRTTDSKTWEGKTLLDLKPHRDIVGVLKLTERELGIIKKHAENAKTDANSANESGRWVTKNVYFDYRISVGFAKEDPATPNPKFNTLEEFHPMKSTKMDVCAQICSHYLKHDEIEDPTFVNGEPIFPTAPDIPSEQPTPQERKIIIYAEFPSIIPLLKNVLKLHGVDSLHIDGSISYQQRDRIIAAFKKPGGPRVLIFSAVGSVGLCLTVADVVIFFDQPWSSQDIRQIRARAHRQPQKKIVRVIHLLAGETTDILLNNMAMQKKDMFEAFVNVELGKELRDLLSGQTVYAPDQDPEDKGSDAPVSFPSKKNSGTRKRPRSTRKEEKDDSISSKTQNRAAKKSAHKDITASTSKDPPSQSDVTTPSSLMAQKSTSNPTSMEEPSQVQYNVPVHWKTIGVQENSSEDKSSGLAEEPLASDTDGAVMEINGDEDLLAPVAQAEVETQQSGPVASSPENSPEAKRQRVNSSEPSKSSLPALPATIFSFNRTQVEKRLLDLQRNALPETSKRALDPTHPFASITLGPAFQPTASQSNLSSGRKNKGCNQVQDMAMDFQSHGDEGHGNI
ncbi:hypothetical protein VNI00_012195 [Paramarasmius palmivorus]|uniref:Helicase C-terminal domain-containing protein n=1 Tax=Paramarasmius palmivorus TaxID=297713 RepID=A0AAW0C8Y2_9AGAR